MVFTLIVIFLVLLVVIGVVAVRKMKGEDTYGRRR